MQAQLEEAAAELRALLPPPLARLPLGQLVAEVSSAGATHAADAPGETAPVAGTDLAAARGVLQKVLEEDEGAARALRRAAATAARLQAEAGGAHVVAPCAHDGVCPMDTPGQTAWCHFSQRVERSFLHRQCATPPAATPPLHALIVSRGSTWIHVLLTMLDCGSYTPAPAVFRCMWLFVACTASCHAWALEAPQRRPGRAAPQCCVVL